MSLISKHITIFAMPKPFAGRIATIQRNAIGSWLQLQPRPQVILFGNEAGVAEVANEFGVDYLRDVERNEFGTPLMHNMFSLARQHARYETMAYVNADIILCRDFVSAISRVNQLGLENYLAIGRRVNMCIDARLDFSDPDWEQKVVQLAQTTGSLAPRVCKDYFIFKKPLFANIPPFAIGRAVYDNWFVYHAHQQGLPVIDVTRSVYAIHQNHDYGHIKGGRGAAYVSGEETKRNRQLAGGMRLLKGSSASWKLTASGIKPTRFPPLAQFLLDSPRLSLLALELLGLKRPRHTAS
ncbi:MAG: hypothetical protein N2C12_17720 [Planctomycetales bacterium]